MSEATARLQHVWRQFQCDEATDYQVAKAWVDATLWVGNTERDLPRCLAMIHTGAFDSYLRGWSSDYAWAPPRPDNWCDLCHRDARRVQPIAPNFARAQCDVAAKVWCDDCRDEFNHERNQEYGR
jgi:hypothetical protein